MAVPALDRTTRSGILSATPVAHRNRYQLSRKASRVASAEACGGDWNFGSGWTLKQYDVVTLFPGMFQGPLGESLVRRAQERGLVTIRVHDLRSYTHDRHRVVDDVPYGGGAGMVLKPEPFFEAVEALTAGRANPGVVLLTPQGRRFTHRAALEFAARDHLVLLCGRYEGFDERIRTALATDEVSIGDFVLSGGELAALVVLEAVIRLVPGVVGAEESVRTDSFYAGLLGSPQYTRPASFRGLEVPPVLLSGDHERIRRWRRKEALRRTREARPDLLAAATLTDEDRRLLREIAAEETSPTTPPPAGAG